MFSAAGIPTVYHGPVGSGAHARRRVIGVPELVRATRGLPRAAAEALLSDAGWMPSRAFAERYPNLIAIGGHPAVDMPPHVVEAAAHAAERPAYAPTLGAPAPRGDRRSASGRARWPVDPAGNVLVTVGGMQALYLAAQCFGARAVSHTPSFFFRQVVARRGRHVHGDRAARMARPTGTRSRRRSTARRRSRS